MWVPKREMLRFVVFYCRTVLTCINKNEMGHLGRIHIQSVLCRCENISVKWAIDELKYVSVDSRPDSTVSPIFDLAATAREIDTCFVSVVLI